MKGAPAICNDYYLMNQIQNGAVTQPNSTDWVTSKGYFPGLPANDRDRPKGPPARGGRARAGVHQRDT